MTMRLARDQGALLQQIPDPALDMGDRHALEAQVERSLRQHIEFPGRFALRKDPDRRSNRELRAGLDR